jgi:hypothetical protein
MIQLEVVQYVAGNVTTVYPIDAEAGIFLQPTRSTSIREIAIESAGGILASKAPGLAAITFGDASAAVTLLFSGSRREETYYAPSHVTSPAVTGANGALLSAIAMGADIGSPGQLSVGRYVRAHAYIDQID